jgi:type I restriction enzyme S subunit
MNGYPPDWTPTFLGALASYINGRAFGPKDWGAHGLPIIRIEQLLNSGAEADFYSGILDPANRIDSGDLVFSWSATLAVRRWDRGPAALNQHLFKVIPRAGVNDRFLHYLIEFHIEELASQSHGSTMRHIKRGDLADFEVCIPVEPEQARIAEVLDTLDEAIREAQAVIFKQGAVYQGLQEQFFTPGAVRDREGWQEMQLEDIAESITSGPRGWATYYADEGDYFLRIGNLTRKHLDLRFDDVVKVKPPIGAEGVRTALAPGDLLISITADLGIIGVVPDWMGVAYINQHIARARLDRNKVNPRFLGYQLSGLIGQKQFYRLNDVGAKAGLNLPAVGGLKVWLPPLAEQDRIAGTLDGLQQALQQEEAVHSNLKSLKSGLSSDLLTGRVRTRPH